MKLYVFYKQEKKKIHRFSALDISFTRLKEIITDKIIKVDVYDYLYLENPNFSDLKPVCKYRIHYSNNKEDVNTKYSFNFSGKDPALAFYNSMLDQGFIVKFFMLKSVESLDLTAYEI